MNFNIFGIDDIEKYLFAVYSNIFGSDIAEGIWIQAKYLIIKLGIKKNSGMGMAVFWCIVKI